MGMAGNFITIYLHLMECLECKSLIAHGALREFQKKNFNSACIFFLNTAFQCFHAGIGYGSQLNGVGNSDGYTIDLQQQSSN